MSVWIAISAKVDLTASDTHYSAREETYVVREGHTFGINALCFFNRVSLIVCCSVERQNIGRLLRGSEPPGGLHVLPDSDVDRRKWLESDKIQETPRFRINMANIDMNLLTLHILSCSSLLYNIITN